MQLLHYLNTVLLLKTWQNKVGGGEGERNTHTRKERERESETHT